MEKDEQKGTILELITMKIHICMILASMLCLFLLRFFYKEFFLYIYYFKEIKIYMDELASQDH
jgi:hypothetical protein